MERKLITQLNTNTQTLTRMLSAFDYESFNHVSALGEWTAGQIAEHLLLLDIRVKEILCNENEPPDRLTVQKITDWSFLIDTSNKLNAPSFLIPSDTPKDPTALADKIMLQRKTIAQAAEEMELDLPITLSPHKKLGVLTGTEWIWFLIKHTERHMQKLQQLIP
jgi:hypothetical protein